MEFRIQFGITYMTLLTLTQQFQSHVRNYIHNQVYDQTGTQSRDPVWAHVSLPVWEQVLIQVRDRISNQARNRSYDVK